MIQGAERGYRWGKFQAWFCLFLAIVQLFLWRTFPLNVATGILLLFAWKGLLWKHRYGFVMVYVLTGVATFAAMIGLAFLTTWDGIGSVVLSLSFWLIPAVFYYPKRYWEFGFKGNQPEVSDATPEEKVLAAVTGPEPIVPATLEPESGGIRKVSYEEFREAVARYRVDRMRDN